MVKKEKLKAFCQKYGHVVGRRLYTSQEGHVFRACTRCFVAYDANIEAERMENLKKKLDVSFENAAFVVKNELRVNAEKRIFWRNNSFRFGSFLFLLVLPSLVGATSVDFSTPVGDNFLATCGSGDFSTLRAATTADDVGNVNSTSAGVGTATNNGCGGGNYALYRYFSGRIDTSSLPDNAILDSVTGHYTFSNANGSTKVYQVVKNRQVGATIATTDLERVGDTGIGTGTPYGTFTRNSGDNAHTYDVSLSTSFIDVTGYSLFAIVDDNDWSNSAPSNSTLYNDFVMNGADAGANYPYITVVYHLPSSSSSSAASSSSAHSVIPPCSGTGCNLANTGSILIMNGACDHYLSVEDGSGNVISNECDSWSTSILIPALKFGVDSLNNSLLSSVIALFVLYIFWHWVRAVIVFLWRLLTFQF